MADENSSNSSSTETSNDSKSDRPLNNKRYNQFMYKNYNPQKVSSQTRKKYEALLQKASNLSSTSIYPSKCKV